MTDDESATTQILLDAARGVLAIATDSERLPTKVLMVFAYLTDDGQEQFDYVTGGGLSNVEAVGYCRVIERDILDEIMEQERPSP